MTAVLRLLLPALASALVPSALDAQGTERALGVVLPNGTEVRIPLALDRGYPAFAADHLANLGWAASPAEGEGVQLRHRTGLLLHFTPESPFFSWDGRLFQLVHAPYWFGGDFHLPLQLLVDLLPGLLPSAYRFDPDRRVLAVEGAEIGVSAAPPILIQHLLGPQPPGG